MDANRASLRVLIIDDDQALHRVFTRILQKEGYHVEAAESGKEALEKIKQQIYDAALIDVKLPDINGLELLPQLKETAPSMIKIVITGYEIPEGREGVLKLGADDFFKKPLPPEVLLQTLKLKLAQKSGLF